MPLFISGSNGISGADGTAALPAVQGTDGNTGVFFPAADQVAIATGGTQRVLVDASGIVTGTAGNLMLVSGTAVASTSGTSIDFTGIPSWARRVTFMLNSVSTNGTSPLVIRLGTSGGFETTGYDSSGGFMINTTSSAVGVLTTGFVLEGTDAVYTAAATVRNGSVVFTNVSGNIWVAGGSIGRSGIATAATGSCGGSKTLAGVLDRIRLTTSGGTDTFDAGSVNILFE